MKNLYLLIVPITVLLLIFTLLNAEPKKLKGNDIVKKGKLKQFEGKLISQKGEWYLITQKDTLGLHFGPKEFLENKKISLKETDNFKVKGYIYQTQIAIVSFVINKNNVELRDKKGNQLWKDTEFSHKITKHFYVVNQNKCIGCTLCVKYCPVGAIEMVNGKAVINADQCINCGICKFGNRNDFQGCPTGAISPNTDEGK